MCIGILIGLLSFFVVFVLFLRMSYLHEIAVLILERQWDLFGLDQAPV